MKKRLFAFVCVIAMMLSIFGTCISAFAATKPTKIAELYVGQTKTVKLKNTRKKPTWKSNNKEIVAIGKKSGKIKALRSGTTIVTATLPNGKKGTFTVVVKKCKHSYDPYKVTVEPTCEERGEKVSTCTICKVAKKTKVLAMTKHNVNSYHITKDPTCLETGEAIGLCNMCGEEFTKTIPKVEYHVWSALPTNYVSPTCGHEGSKVYTCTVCGKEKTETVSKLYYHVWDNGKVSSEPTCTAKGIKTYKCLVCGETKEEEELAKTDHTWKLTGTKVAATCSTDGSGTYACTKCNVTKTDKIPKTEHNYKATVVLPTCTEEGYTQYTCSICKASYTDTNSVMSATGHKFALDSTVNATNKLIGYDVYKCSVCKEKESRNFKYYNPIEAGDIQSAIQDAMTASATKNGATYDASTLWQWAGFGKGSASSLAAAVAPANKSFNVDEIGYGSFAFAYRVSDEVFGEACPAYRRDGNSGITKGDIVVTKLSDGTWYAYFVMAVNGGTLTVADGRTVTDDDMGGVSYADTVKWGVTLNASKVSYVITRYWE